MPRRHRGGAEAGVLLLAYQLWSAGVHNVPPVTLAAIAGMTAVYLGYVPPLDAVYETRMSLRTVHPYAQTHNAYKLSASTTILNGGVCSARW
jgi:hypothetical protein